ncbi:MAG: DUF494 family protein [Bacteroidetes bacterium]|nr:DUF494 family protein [Bacteroidota bacterium]
MQERIIEIIALMLAELKRTNSLNSIDTEELSRRGYTTAEISTAFSWIADKFALFPTVSLTEDYSSTLSYRVLHSIENELIPQDVWGDIIEYQSLGLISNAQIEDIINRTMISGIGKLTSQTLKRMIAMQFTNVGNNLFLGNILLTGNETVN